jgi:Zn-dependent peptidase ImmA (M78 family)
VVGTVSRESDRADLPEVRANAFAAAFLMPEAGVREFLARVGKGQPSRERRAAFDEERVVAAEARAEPGSQQLQLYDVVLLARHFGVSRLAALYRLRNLRLTSQGDLESLLEEESEGRGREIESPDLPRSSTTLSRPCCPDAPALRVGRR